MRTPALVGAYLAAIVAANLSLAHWGPKVAVINGFFLVAFDLASRDYLHDVWRGRLIRNMGLLIAAGSILSYVAAYFTTPEMLDVGRIAMASAVAFGVATLADGFVYHRLRDRAWADRSNGSNIVGATVDSLIFLPLATGSWLWLTMFALACSKIAGGTVFSLLLAKGAEGRAWKGRHQETYS